MSYWDKLKTLLGEKEEGSEEKIPNIEFTPDELREMNDPTTAVGRMLNPQLVKDYGQGPEALFSGAREMFRKGSGSPDRSIDPYTALKESQAAIADAYLKDAEKRGIVSSSDDRITKNYKIINDLIEQKNLKDVKFKNEQLPNGYGEFDLTDNTITLNSSKTNPFEYVKEGKLDYDAVGVKESLTRLLNGEKDSEIYPKLPISKQKEIQNFRLNKHLNTMIHELRHAEDYKNNPEEAKKGYGGHFKNASRLLGEDSNDSGKVQDVQSAALQRLSNMGRKKKSE